MDLQTFDVDVAKEHGLQCAVLFQAIGYWAQHNRSKPDRQRDGKAWMYMSRREWLEEFGYIGEGTLRSSLQKLAQAGLVVTGNYSEGMYARTTWYTLTDNGWELWLKQPKGSAEVAKGFGEISRTITDTHSTTANSTESPSVSPQPTKASRRANPGIRLAVFLANSFNSNGAMPVGWEEYPGVELQFTPDLIERCWRTFHRYFTGPDCSKPLKRDWHRAWENWCDREAQNGRGGRGSRGKTDGGLAAALRTSVANRYGASQPDGGIGGRDAAGASEPDTGGTGGCLAPGEIPF